MAKPTGHGGRDSPDYGISNTLQAKTSFSDLSELAVRLGSPVFYERTGIVMAVDTFSGGLGNWFISTLKSNSTVTLDGSYYVTEPYTIKLHVEQSPLSIAQVIRDFPIPYLARFGVELSFMSKGAFEEFFISTSVKTGTMGYHAAVRIRDDANEVAISDENAVYQTVGDLDITFDNTTGWVVAKMVFDLATGYYTRLLVNMQSYDLTDYPLRIYPSADNPSFGIYLYLQTTQDRSENIWLDNLILTVNEAA